MLPSILLISAILSAVSAEAPPGLDGEPLTIEALREELRDFDYELAEAYYVMDAYGEEVDTGPILERYAHLDDPALVAWLHTLEADATDPILARSYRYLGKNIEDNLLWFPIEELCYEYLATEAAGIIEVGGEEIPYREIGEIIFHSDDRDRRRELWFAEREFIVREINPRLGRIVEATRRRCRELGYADFADYYAKTRGRDFGQLTADCLYILGATRDLHETLVSERLEKVFPELPPEDIRSYDRGQLWRTEDYDEYFPAERLIPLWVELANGIGIDFQSLDNILLDSEDRPEKEPRAACWPMRVPDDIRVLVKPIGGFYDYETLFHEMGHALHFAFTDPELPYEFKLLGDDGVTEAHAFTLENVFENPAYLREVIGMDEDEVRLFRREQLYSEVSSLRYYCFSFLYELVLHGVEADPLPSYRELLDAISIWERTDEEYDTGVYYTNEDFYTTNYLCAWMLEALIRERLIERFGDEWWRDTGTGELLRGLWFQGNRPTPEEIAAELGYPELTPIQLVKRLVQEEAATRPTD